MIAPVAHERVSTTMIQDINAQQPVVEVKSVFVGKWFEVVSVEQVQTLPAIPEKLQLVNPGWAPACRAEPINLVSFKFTPADGKIPQPCVGELLQEIDQWMRDAIEANVLDTTIGIAFSGVIIAHMGLVFGHTSHMFPWAGAFEPRTGGGWIAHVHGAPHTVGEPFFLEIKPAPKPAA